MIPSAFGSGTVPARGTITAVVQFQTSSTVTSIWGPSASPFGGSGILEIETSPDQAVWTPQSIVNGNGVGLAGGTVNSTVSVSVTPLYYRIRQRLDGTVSEWSPSFLFNSALVTPPVATPTSVTITDAAYRFGDRYRVAFDVVQPSNNPAGTGIRVWARVQGSVTSDWQIVATSWSTGTNSHSIDILTGAVANPNFTVEVYNSAGGYDSGTVTSVSYPPVLPPQSESFVFNTSGVHAVTIPAWATNYDYILAGGGGGGEGSTILITDSGATVRRRVGASGTAGQVLTGNRSMPGGAILVIVGLGGGSGGGDVFSATDGGPTQLDITGEGVVAQADGGIKGSYGPPINSGWNEANASDQPLDVTIAGVGTFVAGESLVPTWGDITSGASAGQNVCGGAGAGWRTPIIGTEPDGSFAFYGAPGGVGYARITFKNF